MTLNIASHNLQIAQVLYDFIEKEAAPQSGIKPNEFWEALGKMVEILAPRNRALLRKRDELQAKIDAWHRDHSADYYQSHRDEYKRFLQDISYLVPEGPDFRIGTRGTDYEISIVAGPQLVVPVMNARYALNATNARWGSLFDALYGTDVIPETDAAEKGKTFNPRRGQKIIDYADDLLDQMLPLKRGRHHQVTEYRLINQNGHVAVEVELKDHSVTGLYNPDKLVGFQGGFSAPTCMLFANHGLHLELQFDRENPVGKLHHAGVKDICMESAMTTIQDCEDSVAAVDAADKVAAYRNWLGLMQGTLSESVTKGGNTFVRTLNPDRVYKGTSGETVIMQGRSLLLVRNVGHLMSSNAVLDRHGEEIPEGILDAMVTSLCALHDINGNSPFKNSREGSIYIVKPKMHGPEEVAFTNDLLDMTEDALGLRRNTIKVGVMDEERRTSVNLKECIRAVKDRIFFINTGFLDRTGDEIHTSMLAGPFLPKDAVKGQPWISAYENSNVDQGVATGFTGKAQIGKGMWAKPDMMADMMAQKVIHPNMGANCAWVPSPTAATLHAIHYHQINVANTQRALSSRPKASVDDILTIPLLHERQLTPEQIQAELDNNIQGILGYVVRWIDQGIGCSKVPDIHNVGLMEDRATLRISSQHVANWLLHGICTDAQVLDTLKRMALIVDQQNASDPHYVPIAPGYDGIAFQAASDLIFKGREQPNGYTEPVLHARRKELKERQVIEGTVR
ncbi:MAG: malate synthase G [Pseudomonadales bacterium]|jgi:malate synthase|nr:malate synthase G [Pseudomonadales bacterium]